MAERLKAFKVGKILYSTRTEKPDVAGPLGAVYSGLDDLLAASDVVVVTAALNDSTKDMFDK